MDTDPDRPCISISDLKKSFSVPNIATPQPLFGAGHVKFPLQIATLCMVILDFIQRQ